MEGRAEAGPARGRRRARTSLGPGAIDRVAERTHRDMIAGLELHPALRDACLSAAASWSKDAPGTACRPGTRSPCASRSVSPRPSSRTGMSARLPDVSPSASPDTASHWSSEALVLRLLRRLSICHPTFLRESRWRSSGSSGSVRPPYRRTFKVGAGTSVAGCPTSASRRRPLADRLQASARVRPDH